MVVFECMDAVTSLPFFFSFEISMLGIVLVCNLRVDNSWRMFMIFALIGMLTVFFDFLDNPVLTLEMPLAIYVLHF